MENLERELKEKLEQAKSDEEVIRILAEVGITVTAEQLKADQIQQEEELSEDALDDVSGGGAWQIVKSILRYCAQRYNGGGGGFSSGRGGSGAFGGGGSGGGRFR